MSDTSESNARAYEELMLLENVTPPNPGSANISPQTKTEIEGSKGGIQFTAADELWPTPSWTDPSKTMLPGSSAFSIDQPLVPGVTSIVDRLKDHGTSLRQLVVALNLNLQWVINAVLHRNETLISPGQLFLAPRRT